MQVGKLPTDQLSQLLTGRLGTPRPDVLLAPGIGEDSGIVDFGDEVCVVSTDPITGSVTNGGWLAVHVSCNDVAANGGEPVGIQLALLWPSGSDSSALRKVMDDAHRACDELGIAILGGHTEVLSSIQDPIIVCTALGRCPKDKYVTSTGQRVGDTVLLVKAVGLEGSAILALEHGDQLGNVPDDLIAAAKGYLGEISIVKEALAARDAGVTAMHDVTEGGLYGACLELVQASGKGIRLYQEQVPIRPATRAICRELGLDPLGLISSGALLVTTADPDSVVAAVQACGSEVSPIGEVMETPSLQLVQADGSVRGLSGFYEDELWRWLRTQRG
ncbi:MAG: AIR synthase [Firmicutes bacterium]|nr:AIR synthase [Bacillota bacterium]